MNGQSRDEGEKMRGSDLVAPKLENAVSQCCEARAYVYYVCSECQNLCRIRTVQDLEEERLKKKETLELEERHKKLTARLERLIKLKNELEDNINKLEADLEKEKIT